MIIIVEGPNNVGKSTFINEFLKRRPDFYVEHNDASTPNDYHYQKALLDTNRNVVYDRSYIGERLYAKLHCRTPRLTSIQESSLIHYKQCNIIYVMFDADYNFIVRGYLDKNEEFDFAYVSKERELYHDITDRLIKAGDCVIEVHNHINNYDDGRTRSDALNKIINILEARNE